MDLRERQENTSRDFNFPKPRNRRQQLEECIPDIWDHNSLLYIGAKVVEKKRLSWGGMRWIPQFHKAGYKIDVIEIWPKNVESLNRFNAEENAFNRIIKGDARILNLYVKRKYDIVMWYHGPEHVRKIYVRKTLRRLEQFATKLVIIGCPWGFYKQGATQKNFREIHVSALYLDIFESIGWQTDTIGESDVPGSNILAWKRIQ